MDGAMNHLTSCFEHGIRRIDCAYQRPGMAAIYLLVENGRAALVESGTAHSVPQVLAALREAGLAPEAVDWILLTHVHLDHAGGAGALMAVLPNARLVVHGRGARHMIDPERLWAGTVAVYGEARARALYGELVPVPAARVQEAGDGTVISLAGRQIEVLDAPGHARHHLCYFDPRSRGWFTGDAAGLSYRETDVAGQGFLFPATTPVQFDPQAMHATLERLLARDPACFWLTHFGRLEGCRSAVAALHRLIDASVLVARSALPLAPAARGAAIRAGLAGLLATEAACAGWGLQGEALQALFAADLELNAQGLACWLEDAA